jgi:transcriptional regulator with XRE-family HTH domain
MTNPISTPFNATQSVFTGIPFLDSLLGDLFIGDNVIWYDDAGSLASVFCLNFMQTSQSLNKDIIYVCFDRSPRNLLDKLGPLADNSRLVIIDCFTFGKGAGSPVFLGFYEQATLPCTCRIVQVAHPENAATVMDVFYSVHAELTGDVRFIFESLTGMQELWEGEDQLLNFYAHSCPRLYELNTVAYWIIEKKAHSSRFRAQINQIAQVVIDLSVKRGKTSLTVVKAEKRHGEHLHQPQDYYTREMQVVFDAEAHVHGRIELGMRLKELRIRRGMSQTDLARQIGVTPSTISQVENNLIYPSLPALLKMAEILNIPAGQLLQDAVSPARKIHFTAGNATEIKFSDQPGNTIAGWHLTGLKPDAKIQIHLIEIQSKARISRHFMMHKGDETGYLLSGELQMTLNTVVHSISPGDVVYLEKETPSQWKNTGTEIARLLWMTAS